MILGHLNSTLTGTMAFFYLAAIFLYFSEERPVRIAGLLLGAGSLWFFSALPRDGDNWIGAILVGGITLGLVHLVKKMRGSKGVSSNKDSLKEESRRALQKDEWES